MTLKGKNFYPLLLTAAIFSLDQIVKNWAVNVLRPLKFIDVIPGVFQLAYATNTGAAWSMLSGQRFLLLGISVLAIFVMGYAAVAVRFPYRISNFALFAVLGGALGNFWDRLMRPDGAVIDMFDFYLINFPVFNVADSSLSIGCVMLVIDSLFLKDRSLFERISK